MPVTFFIHIRSLIAIASEPRLMLFVISWPIYYCIQRVQLSKVCEGQSGHVA